MMEMLPIGVSFDEIHFSFLVYDDIIYLILISLYIYIYMLCILYTVYTYILI